MSEYVENRLHGDIPLEDATNTVERIDDNETLAISGFGSVGYPKSVPNAFVETDRDFSLTIISGGSVGKEIDDDLMEAGAIDRRYPYQARTPARIRVNDRSVAFNDRHIWTLGDEVAYNQLSGPYTAIIEAIAIGEDWLIPTTSIGPTPQYIRSADRLIVEVNRAQPLDLQYLHDIYVRNDPPNRYPVPLNSAHDRIGSPRISFDPSKLEAVIETKIPDTPYNFRDLTNEEYGLGENVAEFLSEEIKRNPIFDDTVHLQFGVGNVGNALMATIDTLDVTDTDIVYCGEVIQDGLLEMMNNGLLSTASATSLALSREGQSRLFDDIERYTDNIILRPSAVSNNPSVINRLGIIGVNSAVEIDIYGQANSTHINGTHVINGIGGSGDFIRNSLVSIIALPSTAKDGDISRIVPMVPHVDHTEHDISVVVTEQGVADLRGLSPCERATKLIENCAHPTFRDELWAYSKKAKKSGGHIPHDLDEAFRMHTR